MKRTARILLILIILLLTLTVVFVGCKKKVQDPNKQIFNYSEEADGTIAISGYNPTYELSANFFIPSSIDGKIVSRIAKKAFADMPMLESVSLPESVREISADAFSNSIKLNKINIPANLEIIRAGAFKNTKLTRIDLHSNIKIIENKAFEGAKSLVIYVSMKEENMPANWQVDWALGTRGIRWLVSITIENGRGTKISPAKNLYVQGEEITIDCSEVPDFWTYDLYIQNEKKEFSTTSQNKYIYRLQNDIVISLKEKDAYSPSSFNYTVVEGGVRVDGLKSEILNQPAGLTLIKIPEKISVDGVEKDVIEIRNSAFQNVQIGVQSIIVPSSVKKIGEWAFDNLISLKSVDLKEGIVEIGDYAFIHNQALQSVSIPTSLKTLGISVFDTCNSIETLDLSKTQVKTLQSNSISNMSGLKNLMLPKSLETMESSAIEKVEILELDIPSTVINIGVHAILHCANLSTVYLSENYIPTKENIEEFGGEVYATIFGFCPKLDNISSKGTPKNYKLSNNALVKDDVLIALGRNSQVPSGIKELAPFALENNRCEEIVLPESIVKINPVSFAYFQGKKIDASNAKISSIPQFLFGAEYNGTTAKIPQIETLIIPNTITKIEEGAFIDCVILTKIITKDGQSFEKLNSITEIGNDAFWGCYNLNNQAGISININIVNIGERAFAKTQCKIICNRKESEKPAGWVEHWSDEINPENIIWLSE